MYKHRRALLTRRDYLAERENRRLELLWAIDDEYVALEVMWMFFQGMIQAYGHPKKSEGKKLMERVINTLRKGVPKGLEEPAQLGRTLWRRREDGPVCFDIGASNGPVEAINGRLEHLRGSPWDFGNLDHFILRCLIDSGQLLTRINAL